MRYKIEQLFGYIISYTKPVLFAERANRKSKLLITLFCLVFISACQTGSSGSPGGTPGGSPLPSLPGGAGTPGSPSEQSPPPSSPTGSDGESSDSSTTPPEDGESSDSGSTADTAPDWEDEIESDSSSEQDSEVTFEEPEPNEATFEEPAFEDGGGLSEQELEELERELNESLGDFDEEIQREKTFAEERANDNVDDGALGGVGVFESYEEDQSSSSSSSSSASASAQNGESSSDATSSSDSSESANAGTVSGDQESQSDGIGDEQEETDVPLVDVPEEIASDDIVARQIREAAENETDPELKEALWGEYRKYKNQ